MDWQKEFSAGGSVKFKGVEKIVTQKFFYSVFFFFNFALPLRHRGYSLKAAALESRLP